jgi:hypothetical protein
MDTASLARWLLTRCTPISATDNTDHLEKNAQMATGDAIYLSPHNWGKAVKFLQAPGFELEVGPTTSPVSSATVAVPTFSLRDSRESRARGAYRSEGGRCGCISP